LTEIVCLVDWLSEIGARVDERCHFGIWVDADQIGAQAAEQLLSTCDAFSPGLLSLAGAPAVHLVVRGVANGRLARVRDAVVHDVECRAKTTPTEKRIDFGLFAGSLDAALIVSTVLATVGMVVAVANGQELVDVPVEPSDQLRMIIRMFVLRYRVVPSTETEPSDLRDIVKFMLTRGRAAT
jgi:hypothetical protein